MASRNCIDCPLTSQREHDGLCLRPTGIIPGKRWYMYSEYIWRCFGSDQRWSGFSRAVFDAQSLCGVRGRRYKPYLGYLPEGVFKDSFLFPFALSGIGVLVIGAGLLFHRYGDALAAFLGRFLETLRGLRPVHARDQGCNEAARPFAWIKISKIFDS